jgi:hypothetical protein
MPVSTLKKVGTEVAKISLEMTKKSGYQVKEQQNGNDQIYETKPAISKNAV